METNYFTIFLWFLPYIDLNQSWVYISFSFWTHLPLPSVSPPSEFSQCTGFECPVSWIKVGLVIFFTYGNIHVSVLVSQIISFWAFPTESKSLFISVSLLYTMVTAYLWPYMLHWVYGHHYHLSNFHICAWYIGVFSFWNTSLCVIGSSFIHLIRTDSNALFFNSWVIFHCVYVPLLSYSSYSYSSAKGCLSYFHVLAIINSAVMNIGVNMSFQFWYP